MALGFTHVLTESNGANASSYTTASHSVTGGELVILMYACYVGATPVDAITPSGHSTTWTLEAEFANAANIRGVKVWTGVPPADSTGTVVFDAGGLAQTAGGWSIVEVSGADQTTPIVQSVGGEQANGVGTTFSIGLAAGAHADNRSMGFVQQGIQSTLSADANHTLLGTSTAGAPNTAIASIHSTSAFQTTVGWSSSSNAAWDAGIAFEVAAAQAGGGATTPHRLLMLGVGI